MGITDRRDVVGSEVLVCQTRISCGLVSGVSVSTASRNKLLEEIPFFLRFRVPRVPLAPRFDMVVEGECVPVTSARPPTRFVCHLTGRSRVGGFLSWRVAHMIRFLAKDAVINNHSK